MPDSWNIIGWLILIFVAALTGITLGKVAWIFFDGWRTARRFKRAQAGKVRCEEARSVQRGDGFGYETAHCPNRATRQTPNGFFCEEHYHSHSQLRTLTGGVSFAIPLDYTKEV